MSNQPKWLPFRFLVRPGVLQGLEDHPKAPKSTPKGTPRSPKGAFWEPQGRPKSDQESSKSAQREPKSAPGRPRERQNREKVRHRGEKSRFYQKCSATRPCPCAEHSGPPEIRPKSSQNRPKLVLERLGRPLFVTLVARERLGCCLLYTSPSPRDS